MPTRGGTGSSLHGLRLPSFQPEAVCFISLLKVGSRRCCGFRPARNGGDVVQEDAADDATATPHTGYGSQVEGSTRSVGGALRWRSPVIGHQLGRVQRRIDVFRHFGLVVHHVRALAHKNAWRPIPSQAFTPTGCVRIPPWQSVLTGMPSSIALITDHLPVPFQLASVQNFIYQIAARHPCAAGCWPRNLNGR